MLRQSVREKLSRIRCSRILRGKFIAESKRATILLPCKTRIMLPDDDRDREITKSLPRTTVFVLRVALVLSIVLRYVRYVQLHRIVHSAYATYPATALSLSLSLSLSVSNAVFKANFRTRRRRNSLYSSPECMPSPRRIPLLRN